jgi:hypothetical protein
MKSRSHLGQIDEGILFAETSSTTFERHYTVAEVAALWNISIDMCRKRFQNEPGVLVLAKPTKRCKRQYKTLRIPESVLERVHRQCSLVK